MRQALIENIDLILKIRRSKKYAEWRNRVLSRDGYVCRECGAGFKKIGIISYSRTLFDQFEPKEHDVHHIIPLLVILLANKIRTPDQAVLCDDLWNPDNGLTLCTSCHHTRNYKDQKWYEEFYRSG